MAGKDIHWSDNDDDDDGDDDGNDCYLVNSLLDLEGICAHNLENAEMQSLL